MSISSLARPSLWISRELLILLTKCWRTLLQAWWEGKREGKGGKEGGKVEERKEGKREGKREGRHK